MYVAPLVVTSLSRRTAYMYISTYVYTIDMQTDAFALPTACVCNLKCVLVVNVIHTSMGSQG